MAASFPTICCHPITQDSRKRRQIIICLRQQFSNLPFIAAVLGPEVTILVPLVIVLATAPIARIWGKGDGYRNMAGESSYAVTAAIFISKRRRYRYKIKVVLVVA